MGSPDVDYTALAKQFGGSPVASPLKSDAVDYTALAKQFGGSPQTSSLIRSDSATVSPVSKPQGWIDSTAQWFKDAGDDIRDGGTSTAVGRGLHALGAPGTDHGNPHEVGEFMASPVLGGARMLQGVAEFNGSHPVKGVGDMTGGAMQALQIPGAFVTAANPSAVIRPALRGMAGSAIGRNVTALLGGDQDTQEAVGNTAGIMSGAFGGKAATAAANKAKSFRTPNPDLAFQNAVSVHPADTDFHTSVPSIRSGLKRGADITGTPITSPTSAVEAAQAAQDELIDALADHKTNARRVGATMPVEQVKAAQRAAIPAGLEDSDPTEYNSLLQAIDGQFPNKSHLSVDDVFNQAKLNNNRLHAFYSGKESAQNAKLMTNSGDAGVLKAAGDSYRQWIAENLGQEAADLNKKWGDLNGAKHYLQAKINPAIREQPVTRLEGALDSAGVDLGGSNPVHGIIKGVGKKIIGRPSGIDALLRSTFENTQADTAPLRPNLTPFRLGAAPDTSGPYPAAARDFRASTAGWDAPNRLLPAASGPVGVSGTIVPDIIGNSSRGQGTPRALLPAPDPNNPGVNVLPRGITINTRDVQGPGPFPPQPPREYAAGPGGTVPIRSKEASIPLPKVGNPLGLDERGRPVRPKTMNRAARRATSMPYDPLTLQEAIDAELNQ